MVPGPSGQPARRGHCLVRRLCAPVYCVRPVWPSTARLNRLSCYRLRKNESALQVPDHRCPWNDLQHDQRRLSQAALPSLQTGNEKARFRI